VNIDEYNLFISKLPFKSRSIFQTLTGINARFHKMNVQTKKFF